MWGRGAYPTYHNALFFKRFASLLAFHTFLVITPMCFTVHTFIVVLYHFSLQVLYTFTPFCCSRILQPVVFMHLKC